jgi:hypothetical protein
VVARQAVPVVKDGVATLDGLVNATIAASAIAIFLIPVTFYVMGRLFAGRKPAREPHRHAHAAGSRPSTARQSVAAQGLINNARPSPP